MVQIGKISKPKALDETGWNKNVLQPAKLLRKETELDKIKITDETPLSYLVMHFGYSFHVIFGRDEGC